jgi:16S rRNA (uracil1498-N3)-methyltransferase
MSDVWLFSDQVGAPGDRISLDPQESHHATGPRRLVDGDEVTLFDGRGGVATGTLHIGARRKDPAVVQVRDVSRQERPRPLIHLGFAIPRGDRLSTLLDMCTQVGADVFTPLEFERSVAKSVDGDGSKQERWRRIVSEACKQSRRSWLPETHRTMEPVKFLEEVGAEGGVTLLADPAGAGLPQVLAQREWRQVERIGIIIGPEGGVSDAERESLIAAGSVPASLGATIQRIETAALSACSCIAMTRNL